jgi:hypothetical protein
MSEEAPDYRELIKAEYKKCATNPAYFINKYVYILHPTKGKIIFSMYPFQGDVLKSFMANQYNIILKARQIGLTTLVSAYALWEMLFHSGREIQVIATKQDTAKTLISRVQFAFDNLPIWLKNPCIENNKLSLKFKNGSGIKATTSAKDTGRSLSNSILVIDEAAFVKNAAEIWTASQGSTSTGGKVIIISTPNGVGNLFHKLYTEAEGNANDFNPIKLDWRVHPDRNEEWRRRQEEILGSARSAQQEYDAEFIGSGATVVDEYIIAEYEKNHKAAPLTKTGFDNNIWIWKQPDYTRRYIVAADVARGDGEDKSAFHVLDADTCEQVAEYQGQVDTTSFGHVLVNVSTLYNDAILIVDNSNAGWNTVQTIIDRDYKNLFYMTKDLHYIDMEKEFPSKLYNEEKKAVAGFTISTRTRPQLIAKLQQYFFDRTALVHSTRLLSELKTFIWNNSKAEAMQGYNDDLVLALAMGLWVRDTALKIYDQNVDVSRQALMGIRMTTLDDRGKPQTPTTFGSVPNPYIMPIYTSNFNQKPDEEIGDLRQWL